MKILTRYILKEHISPFVFAFFIITFVLILETLPRMVDLVVGKSVSGWVVLELLWCNLAWMLALSVPMATLVATLTAFGRLTSDSEMLAIKVSGINLMRVLTPVLLATVVLTGLMIEFNDAVLPKLNHKARILMGDIRSMRPTLVFQPGLFVDDIRGYLILLDGVDHKTSEVRGVRINDIRNPEQPVSILADHGLMEFVDKGNTIKFTLYDGEIHEMDLAEPEKYRQVQFSKQIFYVTDIGSELKRTDSKQKTDREMNVQEMNDYIARVERSAEPYRERARTLVMTQVDRLLQDTLPDAGKQESLPPAADNPIVLSAAKIDSLALRQVQNQFASIDRQLDRSSSQIKNQKKLTYKYQIEIYKKYSIPFACIAFVLFGAPLAILGRRSGMGYSISVSLGLFVVYWAFLIGGESMADRGLTNPFWAMWSANFLISGIGLYFVYLVHTEKQFLSFLRWKR